MIELHTVTWEMLPKLSELHVRSWQVAYRGIVPDAYLDAMSAERWLNRWRKRFATRTAEEFAILVDEKIVGLCLQGRERDNEGQTGEIYAFYLHPEEWGKGYAHPAMRLALARLRTSGFQTATLWVLEQNARARRFYQRAGFVLDDISKQIAIGGVELSEVRYRQQLEHTDS